MSNNGFLSLFGSSSGDEKKMPSFLNLFINDAILPEHVNGLPPSAVYFNEQCVYWGTRNLPTADSTKHYCIIGVSGSGKTTAIQLFLQSIAPRFRTDRVTPEQLIVLDTKGDMIPVLAGMGHGPEQNHVYILNPFDARAAVWNLGEAVQQPAMARHLAALIVPEEKNSNAPYFSNAAREVVYAVILGLNAISGGSWSLRDLLCALDSEEHIKGVTSKHPRAKVIASRMIADEKHFPGVLTHIATKIGPFEQVAALWESNKNGRRFSIKKFLDEPGVLILGHDEVLKDSLNPLNAILLKALSQEILTRPNNREPRHWFVLDEFRSMGRVDCIHDLANRGRSKGVSLMLGVLTMEGLYEVYEENGAEDLIAQLAHKTILRAGAPKTAEWAERYYGKVRYIEKVYSESWSKDSGTFSINYTPQERSLFLASFFLDLPFPAPGGTYVTISDAPSLRSTLITNRPFDQLLSMTLPAKNIPGVERRGAADEELHPWTPEEVKYHCDDPNPKPADPEGNSGQPAPRRH